MVIMYFLFSLACKACWGINLFDEVRPLLHMSSLTAIGKVDLQLFIFRISQVAGWVFPFVVLGGYVLMFAIAAILGFALAKLNKTRFTRETEPLQKTGTD